MTIPSRMLLAAATLVFASFLPKSAMAQQERSYDYWQHQREMIRRGQQAVFMCNGLFTSNRTIEQLYESELAFLPDPIGSPKGGDYRIAWEERGVEVGNAGHVPTMRAIFREGIGCIILPPDQTLAEADRLPELTMPYPPGNPSQIPWPDGDLVEERPLSQSVNAAALQRASDWAFDRPTPEQKTISLMVVYKGDIIHERYAEGFDMTTRTRTWSTAKSIATTLIGMLVDEGRLELDGSLGFEWLPEASSPETDPRNAITLRHALNMSTGLQSMDNNRMEYATGSGMSYWAGDSAVEGARDRGLIREPGTRWDYENYDTLLAVYAMKRALGGEREYAEFPRKALFDKIGMRNTLVSTDRFGDFVLSSQVYTNARDLARFGLLYLQRGVWNGERLLSEAWIDFVTSPAPATAEIGSMYGGQFWLVPDDRVDVPKDSYMTNGNRGQFTIIVPSYDLVIVRRGLDYGRQGFDRWGLAREVIKALN